MTKRNKIIYWIATIWLALGMVSTGIVQIIKMKEEVTYVYTSGLSSLLLLNTGCLENTGSYRRCLFLNFLC